MNFSKQNTTSVKVHHNPGGKSNFSLAWDAPEKPVAVKKNQPVEPVQTKQQENISTNINVNNSKTSVKVHNPPGGRSNFTLG